MILHIYSCRSFETDVQDPTEIFKPNFELENFLRELAQIYECSQDTALSEQYSWIAPFGASLLANGFPLEIMDGDATHVPIKWIEAVLSNAYMLLDDPKVFILSVLGNAKLR